MDDSFSARLRAVLDRQGVSQAELARRARVDQATVSRWLSGQSEPNVAQLRRTLGALAVTARELIDDEAAGTPLRAVWSGENRGIDTWLVFRGDVFVGEWTSRSLEPLGAVEVVDGTEAKRLRDAIRAR